MLTTSLGISSWHAAAAQTGKCHSSIILPSQMITNGLQLQTISRCSPCHTTTELCECHARFGMCMPPELVQPACTPSSYVISLKLGRHLSSPCFPDATHAQMQHQHIICSWRCTGLECKPPTPTAQDIQQAHLLAAACTKASDMSEATPIWIHAHMAASSSLNPPPHSPKHLSNSLREHRCKHYGAALK